MALSLLLPSALGCHVGSTRLKLRGLPSGSGTDASGNSEFRSGGPHISGAQN